MTVSVRFSEDQLDDWRTISQVPDADWERAINATASVERLLFSGPEFKNTYLKSGLSESQAFSLTRQLLAARQLARSAQFDLDSASEAILTALLQADMDEFKEGVKSKFPGFLTMLKSESATIASKAHALSMDHDNVLVSSYMVSDTRPVFDGARDDVVGGIIINYLKLEVYEHGCKRNVSYVLDEADIDKLIGQLKDAKKKTGILASLYRESLGIRTFVVGDDSFGGS